jgi:hypothetical protein
VDGDATWQWSLPIPYDGARFRSESSGAAEFSWDIELVPDAVFEGQYYLPTGFTRHCARLPLPVLVSRMVRSIESLLAPPGRRRLNNGVDAFEMCGETMGTGFRFCEPVGAILGEVGEAREKSLLEQSESILTKRRPTRKGS